MNQTFDLEALRAALEKHRNFRPTLGHHGDGIEIEADQLAALIEAAEENERFRSVGDLQRAIDAEWQRDSLKAEVERLREALEEIKYGTFDPWTVEKARAALESDSVHKAG